MGPACDCACWGTHSDARSMLLLEEDAGHHSQRRKSLLVWASIECSLSFPLPLDDTSVALFSLCSSLTNLTGTNEANHEHDMSTAAALSFSLPHGCSLRRYNCPHMSLFAFIDAFFFPLSLNSPAFTFSHLFGPFALHSQHIAGALLLVAINISTLNLFLLPPCLSPLIFHLPTPSLNISIAHPANPNHSHHHHHHHRHPLHWLMIREKSVHWASTADTSHLCLFALMSPHTHTQSVGHTPSLCLLFFFFFFELSLRVARLWLTLLLCSTSSAKLL